MSKLVRTYVPVMSEIQKPTASTQTQNFDLLTVRCLANIRLFDKSTGTKDVTASRKENISWQFCSYIPQEATAPGERNPVFSCDPEPS